LAGIEASVTGVNGQLEFDGTTVKILRRGLMAKASQGFTKGDKSIPIKMISSIQFKKGGVIANGYIQFAEAAVDNQWAIGFDGENKWDFNTSVKIYQYLHLAQRRSSRSYRRRNLCYQIHGQSLFELEC
jgi:hypothetical protein